MSNDPVRRKATGWLVVATLSWGLSFPVMRALFLAQEQWLPGRNSFFFASLCVSYRFGIAALVMLVLCARALRRLTRDEVLHGAGLGVFSGFGLLFQMDGLAHTDASTSAFLTQFYCVIIPWWVAGRDRKWPTLNILAAWGIMLAGVAVLAKVELQNFKLGRGEIETLIASLAFTGQILWLERPRFASCDVRRSSLVMFSVMSVVCLPVTFATTSEAADWWRAYQPGAAMGLLVILVVVCTFGAFLLMNRWQRHVGATLAGMIYCAEPVFASLFALFLPAWLATWTGVVYPNETITISLLCGGALILLANVLAQWKPTRC